MKRILIPLLAACLMCTSCSVLETIANQIVGVANLANCEYSLKNVNNVSVAGVNLKNLSNGSVSATDVVKLAAAIASKKVPLAMNVNIDVNNPTDQQASLTAMDWIMEIEGQQLASGTNTQPYTITAGKTTVVPLAVSTDVYSLFSAGGVEALKKFANSFSADGTSSKVALKIKPSLTVGTVNIPTPNYITLEKKVGGNSSTKPPQGNSGGAKPLPGKK